MATSSGEDFPEEGRRRRPSTSAQLFVSPTDGAHGGIISPTDGAHGGMIRSPVPVRVGNSSHIVGEAMVASDAPRQSRATSSTHGHARETTIVPEDEPLSADAPDQDHHVPQADGQSAMDGQVPLPDLENTSFSRVPLPGRPIESVPIQAGNGEGRRKRDRATP